MQVRLTEMDLYSLTPHLHPFVLKIINMLEVLEDLVNYIPEWILKQFYIGAACCPSKVMSNILATISDPCILD